MIYRGDIQIFRAIAVLQVLLFHLGVTGFRAGFLGVDIFFVISGYLMTKLYGPKDAPTEFYLRRARRLLPAYFAVIAITIIAGFFLTLPTDFRQIAAQVLFACSMTSNIGFWLQNSYFSQTEFNPLLHLWSLGVEFQFYLVFPILVYFARKWRAALPIMGGSSLALCLLLVLVSPKTSFFMLPTRIWEFVIGMWAASRQPTPEKRSWLGLIGFAGMLLVPLLPVFGDGRNIISGHPAAAAILITAATGMALIFRLPSGLVNSFAGLQGQRIGNVSYSLYLVHWPILILAHYIPFGGTQSGVTGLKDTVTCIGAIIIATLLLYVFVERNGHRLFKPSYAIAAIVMLAGSSFALERAQLGLFDKRDNQIFAAFSDRAAYRCGKMFRVLHPTNTVCQIGSGKNGSVLLIGDSHADSIKQEFATLASRSGYATYFSVDNDPLITPGLDGTWLLREARRYKARAVFLHYALGNLRAPLVMAAKRALENSGIRLILILPTPDFSFNVPQELYQVRHGANARHATTLSDYRKELPNLGGPLTQDGIQVIDVAPLFCDSVCRTSSTDGGVLYFDSGHLTLHGAHVLKPAIETAIQMVRP